MERLRHRLCVAGRGIHVTRSLRDQIKERLGNGRDCRVPAFLHSTDTMSQNNCMPFTEIDFGFSRKRGVDLQNTLKLNFGLTLKLNRYYI